MWYDTIMDNENDNVIPFPGTSNTDIQPDQNTVDYNTTRDMQRAILGVLMEKGYDLDDEDLQKDLELLGHLFFAIIRRKNGKHLLHMMLDDAKKLIEMIGETENDSDWL